MIAGKIRHATGSFTATQSWIFQTLIQQKADYAATRRRPRCLRCARSCPSKQSIARPKICSLDMPVAWLSDASWAYSLGGTRMLTCG